jgi:hypothetical protein
MSKSLNLLATVQAKARSNPPGIRPWYQRMPEHVQQELESVRAWFRRPGNQSQTRAVARQVRDHLLANNLKCPTLQTVETWLREKEAS